MNRTWTVAVDDTRTVTIHGSGGTFTISANQLTQLVNDLNKINALAPLGEIKSAKVRNIGRHLTLVK